MVAERHRTGWDHAGPSKTPAVQSKGKALLHPKSSSRHTLNRPVRKGGERYAINHLVSYRPLARSRPAQSSNGSLSTNGPHSLEAHRLQAVRNANWPPGDKFRSILRFFGVGPAA